MVDVGEVVTAVPAVVESGEFDGLGAALGMTEAALPLLFREELEEHDPAGVEGLDEFERPLDWGSAVVKSRPGGFVVRLDGGPVFGEGEADADEGVHVA